MRRRRIVRPMLGFLVLLSVASTPRAEADEIRVFCSNGIKAVMEELTPGFEQATHHKLKITYGLGAALKQQIDAGAPFDLAVLTPTLIDDLIKQGRVAGETRVELARSPIAIAIRAGAPKPDIGRTDALTRTLLTSQSIAYAKEGAGGQFFSALILRLGIVDPLASKVRPMTTGDEVGAAVAGGDAQLGVMPLSEILPTRGVEVLGTFPSDVAGYLVMVAGARAGGQGGAVEQLVAFLMRPTVVPVLKRRGMDRN